MVGEVARADRGRDDATSDQITRERDRAMARYLRDRDANALERTMSQLDREEAAAATEQSTEGIPADVAVRYVRALPETWREAAGGSGRHLLASALFDRIDVLGLRKATIHLSDHAVRHRLAAALPEVVGILVSGRGERSRGEAIRVSVRIVAHHSWPFEATARQVVASLPTGSYRQTA